MGWPSLKALLVSLKTFAGEGVCDGATSDDAFCCLMQPVTIVAANKPIAKPLCFMIVLWKAASKHSAGIKRSNFRCFLDVQFAGVGVGVASAMPLWTMSTTSWWGMLSLKIN